MSFTNKIKYSLNITGGNLTVSGSSTVGNLNAQGMTVGNINLTGALFQNGESYASSQWTTTSGNVSYTSGNVEVVDLTAGNINFSGALYQNGEPYVGSQWTTTSGNVSYTSGSVVATELIAGSLNLGMSSVFSGSFIASNNESTPTDITGLSFDENIASFNCDLMVTIDITTANLYQKFTLSGNKTDAGWNLYVSNIGDATGLNFTITSGGQVQYTSTNLAGYVSSTFRYSCSQISINGTYTSVNPSSTSGPYIYDTLQVSGTQDAVAGSQSGSLLVNGGVTVSKNIVSTGLTATNVSAGAFVGSSATLSGNLTVGGDLTISGTTTTVNTETTILEDNLLVLNSGPAGAADAGLLMKRFVSGTSGSSNYAGMFYKETTDEMTFALTNSDPGASPVTVDSYLPIRAQSLTLESSGSLNARGNSNTLGNLFTTGGNVGIGIPSPQAFLHFGSPSINEPRIMLYSNDTPNGYHGLAMGGGSVQLTVPNTGSHFLAFGSNTGGNFQEHMRINNAGNVGIGTSSPSANLEISSAGTAVLKISGDNANTLPDNGSVQCAIRMTTDAGASGININYGNGNGTNTLNIEDLTTSATTSTLFISSNNNVGIGTTAPGYKLDVNGSFSHVPPGTILMYCVATAPSGFLVCNGSAISRTTYAALFAIIGTTYGVGNGSSTFNLPDLRSRVPVGTGQGTGLTNRTIAATGGAETHTLTTSEMPSHNHTGSTSTNGNHTHSVYMKGNGVNQDQPYHVGGGDNGGTEQYQNTGEAGNHSHTFTTANTGSDGAHNNMQPFLVINYIIKF